MGHGCFYKPVMVDDSSIKIKIEYILNPANCMLYCRGRRGGGRVEHILIFPVNNFSIFCGKTKLKRSMRN